MKYEDILDAGELTYGTIIAEGKTKIVANVWGDGELVEDVVYMTFKNDITAGDGEKHDIIESKGYVDWKTNSNIYKYLNRKGVRTHYIGDILNNTSIVRKLDQKINIEVVVRRIATGSILKHTNIEEGQVFMPLLCQFYYKDDLLHDPLLDRGFLNHIRNNKGCFLFSKMMSEACVTFCVLEKAFAQSKVQLVDFKLEYGLIGDELYLIDEITASGMRLWPYAGDCVDLYATHVLTQLNPDGRLDKDLYRRGDTDSDGILNRFTQVMNITETFKDID